MGGVGGIYTCSCSGWGGVGVGPAYISYALIALAILPHAANLSWMRPDDYTDLIYVEYGIAAHFILSRSGAEAPGAL